MDKILNESPDGIKSKKFGRTRYDDSDAHTFGYYNGEFYIRKGSTHEKFLSKSGDDFTPNVSRSTIKYPGRLWSVRKIISLWKYPENKDDFKKLINDINKNSDLNVNEEWFIEIPTIGNWYHNTESELIKLSDYYQYNFDPDIRGFDDTKPHEMSDYEWSKRGGKRKTAYNTRYHLGRMGDIPAKWKFAKERGIAENSLSKIIDEEINNLVNNFIYHGTGKGQALNIQKDGYMKTNITGEEQPSISFTDKLDYAKHYAKSKAGNKMVILRTKLDNRFKLSPKIKDNKGYEYVTFENIPSSDLEISTSYGWQPLNNWDIIFDEPKQ